MGNSKVSKFINKGKAAVSSNMGNKIRPAGPSGNPRVPFPAGAPDHRARAPAPWPAAPAGPVIETTPMPKPIMYEMTTEIANALDNSYDYRIIGGVALAKLGSSRETEDIDLLVGKNTTRSIVNKLRESGNLALLQTALEFNRSGSRLAMVRTTMWTL